MRHIYPPETKDDGIGNGDSEAIIIYRYRESGIRGGFLGIRCLVNGERWSCMAGIAPAMRLG